jgi:hypothetical protein
MVGRIVMPNIARRRNIHRELVINDWEQIIMEAPELGETKPPTLWDAIKNFFNDNLDRPVSRQRLLDHLADNKSTIDTYRNYLEKAGYMERITRGLYKMIRPIPYDLTVPEVKEEAYGHKLDKDLISLKRNAKKWKEMVGKAMGKDIWSTHIKYRDIKPKKKAGFISESEFKV